MENIKNYFKIRKKNKELESSYINSIECIKKIDKMGNAKVFKPSEYEIQNIIETVNKIQSELIFKRPTIKEEMLKYYGIDLQFEFDKLIHMNVASLYDCRTFFVQYSKSLEVLIKAKFRLF